MQLMEGPFWVTRDPTRANDNMVTLATFALGFALVMSISSRLCLLFLTLDNQRKHFSGGIWFIIIKLEKT